MADAKVDITISAKDSASKVFGAVGNSAAALGKTLAVGVAAGAAAIGAGIAVAVKSAADFEKQMSAVKAVSGATAAEMGQLSGLALKLGQDTSKSASEAAQGIEELVKAGVSVPDILTGAADAAVNLSEATGSTMATAAEVAANAMLTFGKSGSDMAAVTDTITGAVNASAIDINDFRLSMSAAGAVTKLVGGSFDDLSVAVTAMGNAGIKGSDAGTSLKTMLLNLQPTTKEQIKLFDQLGITTNGTSNKFFDAQGKMRGFAEVSGVLEDALAGQTDQQKLATLETLFGSDAIRAAAVMADLGAEGFNKLAETVTRQGQAAEAAKTRMDNLAGDLEQLSGAAEAAGIKLGTAFQEPLRGATQALTGFVTGSIIPFIEQHGPAFAAAAATAAKSLVSGAGSFLESTKQAAGEGLEALRTRLGEMGTSLAEWSSKAGVAGKAVGDALSGVSGIALALQLMLQGNFKGAMAEAALAFDNLGRSADASGKAIGEVRVEIAKLSTTKTTLKEVADIGEDVDRAFRDLGIGLGILAPAAAGANIQFDLAGAVLSGLLRPISRVTEGLANIATAFKISAAAVEIAIAVFGHLAAEVVSAMSAFGAAVASGLISTVAAWDNWRAEVGAAMASGFAQMVATAQSGMAGIAAAVGSGFADMVGRVGAAFSELAAVVSGALGALIGSAGAQASAIGSAIVNGVIGGIQARAGAVASAAASMVTNALQAARNAIGAQSPATEFIDVGEDIDEGLIVGIEEGIPAAEEAAAELGEAVIEAMAESIEEGAPEAEAVAIDLGTSVVEAMAAGLGKQKLIEGAADDLKGTIARAMRDIAFEIDHLNRDTERKFAEIGRKAGDAIRDAIGDASRSIADTIADAGRSISELQSSFGRGRAERAAREAITGPQDAASRERQRNREIEDIQRDRAREDKEGARQLAEDIAKAKTSEEVAEIIVRAAEARDDLLRRRRAEDEDRDYRRKREDEDREFRKSQEQELRRFEDGLDEDALQRSIKRANEDRDARIDAINKALEEKQRKIEEDAREEQLKLIQASQDKIGILKDEFISKLPPLTAQAQDIIDRFLAGINQALQHTANLAQSVGSAISGIHAPSGGGGGGGGGGGDSGTSLFNIPLEGGGNMEVVAHDAASALENVLAQGGTPAGQESLPDLAPNEKRIFGFHSGGIVPGPLGSDQMIMAAGGETVLPTHRGTSVIDYDKLAQAMSRVTIQVSVEDVRSGLLRVGGRNGGTVGLA